MLLVFLYLLNQEQVSLQAPASHHHRLPRVMSAPVCTSQLHPKPPACTHIPHGTINHSWLANLLLCWHLVMCSLQFCRFFPYLGGSIIFLRLQYLCRPLKSLQPTSSLCSAHWVEQPASQAQGSPRPGARMRLVLCRAPLSPSLTVLTSLLWSPARVCTAIPALVCFMSFIGNDHQVLHNLDCLSQQLVHMNPFNKYWLNT